MDKDLRCLIAKARPMTPGQREEQIRNFAAGNVGLDEPGVTRAVVDEALRLRGVRRGGAPRLELVSDGGARTEARCDRCASWAHNRILDTMECVRVATCEPAALARLDDAGCDPSEPCLVTAGSFGCALFEVK